MVFSQAFTSCRQKPIRIRKGDKDFTGKLDFKDIEFLIKVRDFHKIEKRNCVSVSVLGYENS